MDDVTIAIPVAQQLLRDLLCTAVEGGSNYWADFRHAVRTPEGDYLRVRLVERESHADDVPALNRDLLADDLAEGLAKLARATFATAGKHFGDALQENGDAITADVVLQMTVFGEVVYG